MDVLAIMAFVKLHWEAFAIVGGAFGAMYNLLRKQAWQAFLLLCLDLVRKVAVEELSGKEKRDVVVEIAYASAPWWVKKMLTNEQTHQIAEQAYQLLRGELKVAEK